MPAPAREGITTALTFHKHWSSSDMRTLPALRKLRVGRSSQTRESMGHTLLSVASVSSFMKNATEKNEASEASRLALGSA